MAQKTYIGPGEVARLRDILEQHKPSSIFLVTGGKSYESCGAKAALDPILSSCNFTRFSGFEPNPKVDEIKEGISLFNQASCDFVIAVGGGSAMDMAKAVNSLACNEGEPEAYIKGELKIEKPGKSFVAIPTTSGSGSEATHFAVVYIGKTKYSLAHIEFMLPDYAIVDPSLTMSLPKSITAATGMDALCQAIESYWCINSTDESMDYAKEAMELAMDNLNKSVLENSQESRAAMAMAAHLAGKAINISKTTASHAISYPITSYFGVAHGHAVGLTIPSMMIYNAGVTDTDCLDKRGADYVRGMIKELVTLLGSGTPEEAAEKITALMKEIGLDTTLGELGIKTDEDVEIIMKNGFNPGRVKNNPRQLTETALREKIIARIR